MSRDREIWEGRYATATAGDSPSEFLTAHADRLVGRVLDVAGGGGRNALFLARRGNWVDLIDIAFGALQTARRVAIHEGLELRAVQADLERFPLPVAVYDAVINIRYLQRSLFAPLQRAVRPGGLIVFETFLIDQKSIGHPRNPDFLLQHGELRAAFANCEVLDYAEGLFDTQPPAYLARLLARRPQDGIEFSDAM